MGKGALSPVMVFFASKTCVVPAEVAFFKDWVGCWAMTGGILRKNAQALVIRHIFSNDNGNREHKCWITLCTSIFIRPMFG